MREILSHGKRLDSAEWVEGNLFIPDGALLVVDSVEILMGTSRVRISYEVDPGTVGQYTGIHDKNGKKIFEGDIVRDDKGNVGHVEFLIQAAGYVIVWKHCDTSLGHRARGGGYDRDPSLEVIGNIYDNPELLEASDQDGGR